MRVCLVVLGFVTTATLARAQGAPGFRVGLEGGADFPIENQSDVYKTGWNAGILFPINFGDSPFGIRIDGAYHRMDTKDLMFFVPGSGKVEIINGTFDFTLGPRHGSVQPYFLGGVGVYDMKFHGEDVFANPFSERSTRFGWNAGGGIAFALGTTTRFFVEARYTSVSIDTDRFSNSIHTGGSRFTFIPLSAGFVF